MALAMKQPIILSNTSSSVLRMHNFGNDAVTLEELSVSNGSQRINLDFEELGKLFLALSPNMRVDILSHLHTILAQEQHAGE